MITMIVINRILYVSSRLRYIVIDNKVAVDYIGRYESLNDNFHDITDVINGNR